MLTAIDSLESVRRRPTLYVGPLENPSLSTELVKELFCIPRDMAVDQPVKICWAFARRKAMVGFDFSLHAFHADPWAILTEIHACSAWKVHPEKRSACKYGLAVLNAMGDLTVWYSTPAGLSWLEFKRGKLTNGLSSAAVVPASFTMFRFELSPELPDLETALLEPWAADSLRSEPGQPD